MTDKLDFARELFDETIQYLKNSSESLDSNFLETLELMKNCKGKLVFSGVGKSGHVAKKVAASYSSTGNPSIFLNPVEALHGDLGGVDSKDVIILLSHSGNTQEVLELIPSLKNFNVPIISITSNSKSKLAKSSNYHINTTVSKEICPFNLAPTTSTTVTLVILDVLMVMLMKEKGFRKESFALFHPAGSLGKRLILKIEDLIDSAFSANSDELLDEVLIKMSKGSKGLIPIVENGLVVGVVTDGDIRRIIEKYKGEFTKVQVSEVMTKTPKTILKGTLAIDVLNIMEEYNITAMPIVDSSNKLLGVVNIHDILKSGLK